MSDNSALELTQLGGEALHGSGFELEPESLPTDDEDAALRGGDR